jgi:ATP-dependent helicase/nuclease subunit B
MMGASMLAPEIRALGDIEENDAVAAFGPDVLDLPPALSPAARRGALARLVQAWRVAGEMEKLPPRSLLSAADELCTLLDQAGMAGGVDWTKLSKLVPESDFALHWQNAAEFLEIITQAWPEHLKEVGASDTQTRRLAAAEALRTRWAKTPPNRPVIIAGSTGAGAATRILMEAVLQLPKGLIVLPGLDADLSKEGWIAVNDAASHPQHTLLQTLKWLRLAPEQVREWPYVAPGEAPRAAQAKARRRLFNEALAPAAETRGWNERLKALASPGSAEELVTAGLEGLSLVEAEDEGEEALAAALLLRETLEAPGKTAALVTPENSLARRVSAIMERWGLDISPSSGIPLHRTRSGGFVLMLMRWVLDPAEPVQLLAMLKHPAARMGRTPDALNAVISELELAALRGPRMDQDLPRLAARLVEKKKPDAAQLIRDVHGMLDPLSAAFEGETIDGAKAAAAIAELATALGHAPGTQGEIIWAGKQGQMAAAFLKELAELSTAMGAHERQSFPDFAEAVMQGMTAAPETEEHPRIAIWGPLEARLQRRDRVILASLNEGSWPRASAADAFLNRKMRRELALPDPDERIGLSAHDFAQMANAPEVILLRAKRVDDKPAVASRWLWRLRTLAAAGMGGREAAEMALHAHDGADPLVWAQALRKVGKVKSAEPPNPKPPVAARALNEFSPSRVVTLIRDPYADYARRILRLRPRDRVGKEVDARERGTAVHAAVDRLDHEENETPLDELIVEELLKVGAAPELIELEKPLWMRAGKAYARWLGERAGHRVDAVREQTSKITLPALFGPSPGGDVVLEATADRVEKLADGTLAMIDFKTGQPKRAKQVQSGLEPQLALEAAIGARAGFDRFKPAPTSELIYFRMALSARTADADNGQPLEFDGKTTMQVAEDAFEGLQKLIKQYADPKQGYLSKPRVEFIWSVSDYDRLARRAEWGVEEGEE